MDEHWVRVVTVNIYRTVAESLQTFEYMTSLGKFSAFEQFYVRYVGACLGGLEGVLHCRILLSFETARVR